MLKRTPDIIKLFLLIVACIPAFAQSSNDRLLELAAEAFKADHYQSAIDYYTQAEANAPTNAFIKYQLAESYRKAFQYAMAEEYYEKVISIGSADYPLVLFNLGLTQKLNSGYAEAQETFQKFITYAQTATFSDKEVFLEQAKVEQEGCRTAIAQSSVAFREFNLTSLPAPVNSKYNDYAAYPYRNDLTIVITSGREEAVGKKEDSGFDEDQTDCFRFTSEGGAWKPYEQSDSFDKMNASTHEGAGTFNMDYTKYYFTKCGNEHCSIYYSQWKDGKWKPAIALNANVNMKGTESKHPFVSSSGDTLFFVSNRPGGFGMNDIYMSISNGNDQWGPAVNLGSKINTRLNEASPFYLASEGVFAFSSQGHAGFGGLDILIVRNLFVTPIVENIGKPFNSNADDFYFVFGTKTGYLSSNRQGGKGKFDIYTFNVNAEESVIALLEKKQPLVLADASTAQEVLSSISMSKLDRAERTSISGTLIDRQSGKPMKGVEALLIDESGQVVGTAMTDENGLFAYSNVPSHHNYKVVAKRNQLLVSGKHDLGVTDLKVEDYIEKRPLESISTLTVKGVDYVSLSGNLLDPATGKPLKRTEALLVDEEGKVVQTVMTDENGSFIYSKVPPHQKYTVVTKGNQGTLKGKHALSVTNLKVDEYVPLQTLVPAVMLDVRSADYVSVSGYLHDPTTGKARPGTEVYLVDETGKIIQSGRTDENGAFVYSNVPPHHKYSVLAKNSKGILAGKHELNVTNLKVEEYSEKSDLPSVNTFNMDDFDNVSISGTLYDRLTGQLLKETEILLVNEKGEVVKVTSTNEEGYFRYTKIPLQQNYKVTVRKKSGLLTNQHELSVVDLKVEGYQEKSSTFKFESIYFDFDKSELRTEAMMALNELSTLCMHDKEIQIEIDAFTDIVGTDQYNSELSTRRGQAVFDYLINRGVDRSSLVVNSMGRQNPVANNNTPDGRQLNRRVEFVIKGLGEYSPTVSTYIIEPGMTLFTLAKKYNTTVEELVRLNGLQSYHIEAHRPMRVPVNGSGATRNTFSSSKSGAPKSPGSYRVKAGDTVFSIAVAHNMTVERFKEINDLTDNKLLPGQLVKVESR